MEKNIDITRLYAESFYRKLVAMHFDLKDAKDQKTDNGLEEIQIMFNELKQKLLDLNIRTNFSVIQCDDAFDSIKMIEELMLHIENTVLVLNTLQMKYIDNSNEKLSEFVSTACVWARDTLWKVRVVEGKLDAIVNARTSRWGNYSIETYLDIKELFSITEELAPYLNEFEKLLKNLNINETLEFSLDIPLEYTKNYFMFLVVPASLSRSVFTEKFEQIQTLRKKIEQIIENLKNYQVYK